MEDWKDLDNTTPLDILINMNKYQIQVKVKGEWKTTGAPKENILREMQYYKYRYLLKPLESMRVTREVWDMIVDSKSRDRLYIGDVDGYPKAIGAYKGRPVEIIEG